MDTRTAEEKKLSFLLTHKRESTHFFSVTNDSFRIERDPGDRALKKNSEPRRAEWRVYPPSGRDDRSIPFPRNATWFACTAVGKEKRDVSPLSTSGEWRGAKNKRASSNSRWRDRVASQIVDRSTHLLIRVSTGVDFVVVVAAASRLRTSRAN